MRDVELSISFDDTFAFADFHNELYYFSISHMLIFRFRPLRHGR